MFTFTGPRPTGSLRRRNSVLNTVDDKLVTSDTRNFPKEQVRPVYSSVWCSFSTWKRGMVSTKLAANAGESKCTGLSTAQFICRLIAFPSRATERSVPTGRAEQMPEVRLSSAERR